MALADLDTAPVQLRLKAMLPSESGDISSDPEVAFDPDQPPLALQDVAFVEDQDGYAPPTTNWLISVLTVTVGDTATGVFGPPPPPPPQADNKVVRISGRYSHRSTSAKSSL